MARQIRELTGGTMDLNADSPRATRNYLITDRTPVSQLVDYFQDVADYVNQYAANQIPFYDTPAGRLHLNQIRISEIAYGLRYEAQMTYTKFPRFAGSYQIIVDGTGGTVHVPAGVRVSGWGASGGGYVSGFGTPTEPVHDDKVDNGGLIGVEGDEVRGIDVQVPHAQLTIMFRHTRGFLTDSYVRSILPLVGHPNSDTFFGYDPGELKLIAPRFTQSDVEQTAEYVFDVSPNVVDLELGDITIDYKAGWDVISPNYYTTTNNDRAVRRLRYVEIVRPPLPWKPYLTTLGWGFA